MKDKLLAVRKTLSDLTITGYENMSKVVGCIQYLDQMIEEVSKDADDHAE